jgi:hypothetical protein
MLKFLMTLLGVIDKLLGAWQAHHWKRQGHQEAAKEAAHEIEQQIALGEAANNILDTTDPVPLSNYCALTKPITYDTTKDTPETVAEIEAHNSRYECVCNHDCPKGVNP